MKKLSINGVSYPCRLTMGAMLRYHRETGKEVSELSGDDLSGMIVLIWCCLKSACNADKVNFDMSLDDFADAMDPECISAFYEEAMEDGGKKKE